MVSERDWYHRKPEAEEHVAEVLMGMESQFLGVLAEHQAEQPPYDWGMPRPLREVSKPWWRKLLGL